MVFVYSTGTSGRGKVQSAAAAAAAAAVHPANYPAWGQRALVLLMLNAPHGSLQLPMLPPDGGGGVQWRSHYMYY